MTDKKSKKQIEKKSVSKTVVKKEDLKYSVKDIAQYFGMSISDVKIKLLLNNLNTNDTFTLEQIKKILKGE